MYHFQSLRTSGNVVGKVRVKFVRFSFFCRRRVGTVVRFERLKKEESIGEFKERLQKISRCKSR